MTGGVNSLIADARGRQQMASSTVGAGYVRALLERAVACGGRRDALLAAAGLRVSDLTQHDARVSADQCSALMRAAIAASGDAAFALKFGETLPAGDLSVALMVAGAAETVGQGRVEMNRLGRLIRDGEDTEILRLVRDGDGVWLQLGGEALEPWFAEAGFAWCVTGARAMVAAQHGGRPFLRGLRFRHAEPGHRAEYDRIFAVPISFGADRDGMLIDDSFLQLRLPEANPYVSQLLAERAEMLLSELDSSKSFRGRVEHLLQSRLKSGQASMASMAGVERDLGLSRQTLARRLKAEGTTFEQVLAELRREIATRRLAGEGASISQTAYLLGFSDPAAFSRAFKRWTGHSPSTFRAGSGTAI